MNELKVLCAWCKKDMGTGQQLTDDEYKILSKDATHGICQECLKKELAEPPPDCNEFPMNIDEAHVCQPGGGSINNGCR